MERKCDRCGTGVDDEGTCLRVVAVLAAQRDGALTRADDVELFGDRAGGYFVRCRIPTEVA